MPRTDYEAARVEFGRRVRARRQELGMRQVDLGNAIGRTDVSYIETAQRHVSLPTLLALADALDTDAATLVAGL